ncbi:uncharacterized protein LOC5515698 isoform X1 [Nematostella vectensis]|uniref:uncharacterized protein LOC5515698 isoform X1 n=2 Tax=Nematostella vectensis TaxID=45351 RepID=UPI0020776D31|nr:uncharacterized protein LOC5515698 isoform X1 [Nematostella vectensis]
MDLFDARMSFAKKGKVFLCIVALGIISILFLSSFQDRLNDRWISGALLKEVLNGSGYKTSYVARGCDRMSISDRQTPENKHCRHRQLTREECKRSKTFYDINDAPKPCKTEKKVSCTAHQKWRESHQSRIQVSCDMSGCGLNRMFVASFDSEYGVIEDQQHWQVFQSKNELEKHLPDIVIANSRKGNDFCFLGCLEEEKRMYALKSIFLFPPVISLLRYHSDESLFNINVVVLDSVSRAHFYRMLPQTVDAFRSIVSSDTFSPRALDFEFLQAIAPYTFSNLKTFFTGKASFEKEKGRESSQDYGVVYFNRALKQKGFQVLFQEDSCWHDPWGLILTNGLLQPQAKDKHELRSRWKRFGKHFQNLAIDSTGPTHASCLVFQQFNSTNQFNKPKELCFGGKPLVSYFLEAIESLMAAERSRLRFSFTMLAVGHEVTGLRVKQIDGRLAQHVHLMAASHNTLTMIFSDHGPKTTPYSHKTKAGLYEVYNSFLFMILPDKVSRKLGKERTRALVINQKRLISLQDVHEGLASLIFRDTNETQTDSSWQGKSGIFEVISESRTCSDVPMQVQGLCVCNGQETWFPDNHRDFAWIAEFALGELNNRVQASYRKSGGLQGYGKCQRFIGVKYANIHQRKDTDCTYIGMNIIVWPLQQSFEMLVKIPQRSSRIINKARLLSLIRTTTFQTFLECKDDSVPVRLCACETNQEKERKTEKVYQWLEASTGTNVMTIMQVAAHFSARPVLKFIDKCVVLNTRSHNNGETLSYEIGSVCSRGEFYVRFDGRVSPHVLSSAPLPQSVLVTPLSVQFVFTVRHLRKPFDFKTDVTVKIV